MNPISKFEIENSYTESRPYINTLMTKCVKTLSKDDFFWDEDRCITNLSHLIKQAEGIVTEGLKQKFNHS